MNFDLPGLYRQTQLSEVAETISVLLYYAILRVIVTFYVLLPRKSQR